MVKELICGLKNVKLNEIMKKLYGRNYKKNY